MIDKPIKLEYSLEDFMLGIILAFKEGFISLEEARVEVRNGIKSWTWRVSKGVSE